MSAAQFRDKTIRELRVQRVETATLLAVLLVSIAAMTASFVALYWVGTEALGWPRPIAALFPLSIDGLAATASAATVIFAGKATHLRAFAWLVFLVLLAVSLAGNVTHAMHVGHPELLPQWLFIGMASIPPISVALGVHLYTTIAQNGMSGLISAVNRSQIIVDVEAFESGIPARRPARRPAIADRAERAIAEPTRDRAPAATSAPVRAPQPPRAPSTTPGDLDAREAAAFAEYARLAAAGDRPDGAAVAQLLLDHGGRDQLITPSQGRKVRARWDARIDEQQNHLSELLVGELRIGEPARAVDVDLEREAAATVGERATA